MGNTTTISLIAANIIPAKLKEKEYLLKRPINAKPKKIGPRINMDDTSESDDGEEEVDKIDSLSHIFNRDKSSCYIPPKKTKESSFRNECCENKDDDEDDDGSDNSLNNQNPHETSQGIHSMDKNITQE